VGAVFKHLAENGIDSHSYDMRGAGRTEMDVARRAMYPSFDALVDDLLQFCDHVQSSAPLRMPIRPSFRLLWLL
jgi:alpha-beta hydrolase superfamily lysophospholipase